MTTFHRSSRLASFLAGLATTVLASTAFAQGATITGKVKSEWGQVLQAVNVRIAALNVSDGTAEDGTYLIRLAPERVRGQVVTLSVRAVGYKPQSKQITIATGMQDHDFTLESDPARVWEGVATPRDTARKTLAYTVTKSGQSYTVTRPDSSRTPGASDFSQHLFPPELVMQHQAKLKITEAQRNAIVVEITKLQATAVQVQWRVGDESEKLSELLQRETVDEAEALAQVDRMINYETAVKRAQLSMLIRIRNTLTPEQRQMLQELRKFTRE